MPLAAQVKLLRLLEEHTFERVGGVETLEADARIVAATNRDLRGMVEAGTFRGDLYYRLQVFRVQLPPLRDRQEDVPLLAIYFMERMAAHLDRKLTHMTPGAFAALGAHDWPGNVRELEHAVQRAVIVCPGPALRAQDIGPELGLRELEEETLTLEEVERRHILSVLQQTGWVIRGPHGAATRLGMPSSTLRHRMEKLGIVRP